MRQTSIEVYNKIKIEGLLERMAWKVYDELFHHGPLTGRELNRNLQSVSAHKRLSELERMGAIRSNEIPRTCTVSGERVLEWDVTDVLPTPIQKVQPDPNDPVPTKDELRKATKDLREMYRMAVEAGFQPSAATVKVCAWIANGAPMDDEAPEAEE
jgi:hypothetical protein